jgi:hypothetical protein
LRLQSWQAGDKRLWKLIVSPEFGDRVDLSRLTRDLVRRMEGSRNGTRMGGGRAPQIRNTLTFASRFADAEITARRCT